MEYVRKISSELQTGDVVGIYGMRVRLDECVVWENPQLAFPTIYSWHGTVLNSAELPSTMGPIAKWTVQGNDLARWSVETTTSVTA